MSLNRVLMFSKRTYTPLAAWQRLHSNCPANFEDGKSSFAELSHQLAVTDLIEDAEKKKLRTKRLLLKVNKSKVKTLPDKQNSELSTKSFQQILDTSRLTQNSPNQRDADADRLMTEAVKALADSMPASNKTGYDPLDLQSPEMDAILRKTEELYPLDKLDPARLSNMTLNQPTFNLSAVVNDCPSMQKLLDLGVVLSQWEKMGKAGFAMSLDFDSNVSPKINFLMDHGIKAEELGGIFTKNPDFFLIDEDDLKVRIQYLEAKHFTKSMILKIIRASESKWLNFDVKDVDTRLGYFQKAFGLKGSEVRKLSTREPNLIIWNGTPYQVNLNKFAITDNMGFTADEAKSILLGHPVVYLQKFEHKIVQVFNLVHNEMGLPHEHLAKFPEILVRDFFKIRDRHQLLKQLGRNQYNPKLPNYISPMALTDSTDDEFCLKHAKIPVQLYNQFLKTL